jgi:hypothetical protein
LPEQRFVPKPLELCTRSAFRRDRRTHAWQLEEPTQLAASAIGVTDKLVDLLTRVRRSLRGLRALFPSGG